MAKQVFTHKHGCSALTRRQLGFLVKLATDKDKYMRDNDSKLYFFSCYYHKTQNGV